MAEKTPNPKSNPQPVERPAVNNPSQPVIPVNDPKPPATHGSPGRVRPK